MKCRVAKRAWGVVLASAMAVTTVGGVSVGSLEQKTVVRAAGSNAIYVDDVNYYDQNYDAQYAYQGDDLGCTYSKEKTVFKVWSPEADKVTLNLYQTGSDEEVGSKKLASLPMEQDAKHKGVWVYEYTKDDLKNIYYTYSAVIDGQCYGEAVDPYAKAVGVNGERGMVVDLDSTDPSNWDDNYNKKRTATALSDIVVWEVHVRDFSIDVSSGVSKKNRGKYKAFTETTTVNGEGKISSCVDYLKKMGVTHVQLMPSFDYDGVDETTVTNDLSDENYNWGYNPVNYNAPEGSYSSDPYDGNTRIKEMKQMIQALHDAGIKVIMDVVYNHTSKTADSNFNLLMPDYYYKLTTNAAGEVVYNDESGCGNATRSESAMYQKFMIDSLTYWADEYNIDGYRFDLMGIHTADTMNAIRKALDKKFGEDTVVMYGEGWTGGGYQQNSAYKEFCRNLDDGIGYFNDQIRDAIKGETSAEKAKQIGFVQQNYGLEDTYTDHEKFPTSVFGGIMGSVGKNTSQWWMWRAYWADTSARVLAYVSCHDNMTIWDKFVESLGVKQEGSSAVDYNTTSQDLVNMSRLAAGYLLTSHGGTFLHAGEEFGRTKSGDENSYRSGDNVNKIDWNRVGTYANMTNYYQGMIAIRKAFSGFRTIYTETGDVVEENTEKGFFNKVNNSNLTEITDFTDVQEGKNEQGQIQSTVNSIGYYLSNTAANEWSSVAVLLNNTTDSKSVELAGLDGTAQQWVLVSNGKKASVQGVSVTAGKEIIVPGKSVVVAVPKNTFDQVSFAASQEIAPGTEEVIATPAPVVEETPAPQVTETPASTAVATQGPQVPTATAVSIGDLTLPEGNYQYTNKELPIAATALGGNGKYEYRFYVYKDNVLVSSSAWGATATFTYTPKDAGMYTIKVVAKDTEGRRAEAQKNMPVIAKKVTVSRVQSDKSKVKKGKKLTFTVQASGGLKNYTYSFKVKKKKGGVVKKSGSISKNKWSWKANKKGSYQVQVVVKDQLGMTAKKTSKTVVVK